MKDRTDAEEAAWSVIEGWSIKRKALRSIDDSQWIELSDRIADAIQGRDVIVSHRNELRDRDAMQAAPAVVLILILIGIIAVIVLSLG